MDVNEKNGYTKCPYCATTRPRAELAPLKVHVNGSGEVIVEACKDREWCRAQPISETMKNILIEVTP